MSIPKYYGCRKSSLRVKHDMLASAQIYRNIKNIEFTETCEIRGTCHYYKIDYKKLVKR
jgi:hypothetical protein